MAERRPKLDAILRQIVKDACGKENVYYQPPANLRLSYPCICYEKSKMPLPITEFICSVFFIS